MFRNFTKKKNMRFQLGDRVKFLNSKGGGVITKIISPSLVNVMIEDGFEIPTITSELVKVDPKGKAESMFDEDFGGSRQSAIGSQQSAVGSRQSAVGSRQSAASSQQSAVGIQQTADDRPEPDRQSVLGNYSFRAKNTPGIYLAFVPHDQKWLVTGMVEIYLVNHTTMDALYVFYLEGEKKLFGKDYDVLFAGNKILIDTIDRDELLKWTKGIVQVIFYTVEPDRIVMPVSTEFDLAPSRFNDENNYKALQFMEERLLLVSIAQSAALNSIVNREESKMDEEALIRQRALEVKPASLIEKHQTSPREAVVDLHIGELLVDFKNMTPYEILKFQMDYFNRCIDSAAERNFRKVTFIHGVGNGTLKNAIIKRVNELEHAESHLASLARFGVGAIDVTIKPLK
ncbi:MAG: DUF2027 domain-containing protein [Bacteroidales bacterium]|nr:DUF2027 domain-containing protein [Bacteroidales bacterium]